MSAIGEWRAGWRAVVAGSVGMGSGIGLYTVVSGLFIRPLEAEFGWSRGQLAAAGLFAVLGALLLPLIGIWVDRYGVKHIAALGMLLLAAGYLLLSFITAELWHYYVVIAVFVFTGMLSGPLVFTKAVNSWFAKSRGLALGVTLSGVTVTATIALPVLAGIIEAWGWRAAFRSLAVLPLVLGLPVVWLWLREQQNTRGVDLGAGRVEQGDKGKHHSLPTVLKDTRFWLLAAGLAVANIAVGGMLSQLQPLLFQQGYSPLDASLLGSVFAVSIALGRLGAGWLLDRFWPPLVAALFLLSPVAGIEILTLHVTPGFYLGACAVMLVGLAQGAEIDFIAYFVPRYFGSTNYGSIFGVLAMVVSITLAIGGITFGYVYDVFGSYHPALWGAQLAYVVGAVLVVLSGLVRPSDHVPALVKSPQTRPERPGAR